MTAIKESEQLEIKQMRLDGNTIREIAQRTGFAMSTVERYLAIFGMTRVAELKMNDRSEESQRARWKLAMPW